MLNNDLIQKQGADAAQVSNRASMAQQYGMWYKEGATASDLVSW